MSKNANILKTKVSEFLIKNGLQVEYPDGSKFAVCLTHDIDVVNFSRISTLKNVLKFLILKNKKLNLMWDFEDFMKLEDKYDAKSSFFFLTVNKEDMDFNFGVEDLEYEIGNIADKGWEVGLHGGHEAYNNLDVINKNKKQLEKVLGKEVIGYRNHYLRFKVPDTWELLSKSGFKYDTTYGYADCVGFRNGTCHPFKPFNLNTNEEIDILEIPLTIMDRTLFDYMKLDMKGRWDITKLLIDTVEKNNGVITILWHNTFMIDENLRFYEKILKYCHEKRAWMTSGEEIEKNRGI
jgi:peptidoglycan/xylan/chitin deacetylase (PgdA/CDA1 family)